MAAPRRQPLLLLLLVGLLAASAPRHADAWGKEGHIMVCKIAERYLSEEAAAAVQELLPESAGGELSTMCPWADTMRFRYHWASPLHYANTPNVCNFNFSRDCHNSRGQQGMCVVGAINNYTEQLYTYGDSPKSSCVGCQHHRHGDEGLLQQEPRHHGGRPPDEPHRRMVRRCRSLGDLRQQEGDLRKRLRDREHTLVLQLRIQGCGAEHYPRR